MTLSLSHTKSLLVIVLSIVSTGAQAIDPEAVGRGKYLYDAAGCGSCHGDASPSGGLGLDTPFGVFNVPNITPDKRNGIGTWSQADFHKAMRDGIGKNGEYLFPVFPFTSFTNLTDRDIDDLYAYLMSLPPASVANKPHQANAPFGWRSLLVF